LDQDEGVKADGEGDSDDFDYEDVQIQKGSFADDSDIL